MNIAIIEQPAILHELQDRVRVHVPAWSGSGKLELEAQLRQLPGVKRVQANALTHNALLEFDPAQTNAHRLLDEIHSLNIASINELPATTPELPPVQYMKLGTTIRARVAVRGIERDPQLAQKVVDQLEHHTGVRARADQLTGRVLIEFTEHEAELEELLTLIADVELPELPDDDRPSNPLDPAPLVQSMTRSIGAAVGLGFMVTRRLLGAQEPLPGSDAALTIASVFAILQGTPARTQLRRLVGRPLADLLFSIPSIVTLTLAESPVGLAISESEALRLLTEVRARRATWRRYEERIERAPSDQPGDIIRLESGERTPLAAQVLEGTGLAIGLDALPIPIIQGHHIPPGARVFGGSFLLQLTGEHSFQAYTPEPRSTPPSRTLYQRYLRTTALGSLLYAGLTAFLTRSLSRTLIAMLLVNARPAIIGQDSADLGAFSRVMRAGVVVVGTRPNRTLRLPNLLLLDGARLLTDRLELASVTALQPSLSSEDIQMYAANLAGATGSPWGGAFGKVRILSASDGHFDGRTATATIDNICYSLGPLAHDHPITQATPLLQQGYYVLALYGKHDQERQPLGLLALRPRLVSGVKKLVQICGHHGVKLALVPHGNQLAAQALSQRAHITLAEGENALHMIHSVQQTGGKVAFVADNINAAAAFEACDLAIGLNDSHSRFPAQADILAPDLQAICSIIEAAARRELVARDSLIVSIATNIVGAVLGLRQQPNLEVASRIIGAGSLLAIVDGWLRLRGGERALSANALLEDPHPERWGRRSIEEIQLRFQTSEQGLSSHQAATRRRKIIPHTHESQLLKSLLEQFHSPLIGLLAAGATLSLSVGAVGDVALIGATILLSVTMSVWQDQKANQIAATLQRMDMPFARVLRDGQSMTVPASEIVTGDVLLLAPGDRITADARITSAQGLETDESALTGESLPVPKVPDGKHAINRIVLEGTDVTTGTGRAIVVAVGKQTQMGATREALTLNGTEVSPLGVRLSHMLRLLVPLSLAGGVAVIGAGLLWGQPIQSLLALGVTVSLAAVPEGLPLLAKVGEAGVAHRLSEQQAVIRRLSAIETLGRVDVACADKTGTMTMGQLRLSLVASPRQEARPSTSLPLALREVLCAAAMASPQPGSPGIESHPTDLAIVQGALDAGLRAQIDVPHEDELPFDPSRAFHASRVQGRLYLKGAPETLLTRCTHVRQDGKQRKLTENIRHKLAQHTLRLSQQGLRILMVAEGSAAADLNDPQGLTMLGFIGISDPLRDTVRMAVNRCNDAGIHVIMITGDHPSTARAIATEAGLLSTGGQVYTASELAELSNEELDQTIEQTAVVARATPLDKLRIIESLQRRGHTVAMTGDGVNDAPALRLANVGVAMGGGSTEVARQTADVVIANDDFSTLVETFVEGRSFWRNIRRALGLLLGGNLGELGLIMGASLLGNAMPLNARQILALNAITDILPALAVALQQPEHRNLAELSREGTAALGEPLRNEIIRRSIATALPSLVSYMLTLKKEGASAACSIAYASVIMTQLAQTLDAGRSEGHITRSVLEAVVGSVGVLAATFAIPPIRGFLGLTIPSSRGLALIGGGTIAAVLLSHLLTLNINDLNRALRMS